MPALSRRGLLKGAMLGAGGLALAGVGLAATRPKPALAQRPVVRVITPHHSMVGEVLKVKRTIPAAGMDALDPFLMLDNFDFTLQPGQMGGLAPHPHRGFETITLMAEGEMEHGDSLGNRGIIASGDIQWMTAGDGIVHEENPSDAIRERGGRILGVQLWLNLPKQHKMVQPKYQDTVLAKIPAYRERGIEARVYAGEAFGLKPVISTFSPVGLVDVLLQPNRTLEIEWPQHWNAFVQAVDGPVTVGTQTIGEGHLALTGNQGQAVVLKNDSTRPVRALLGGGLPLNEQFYSHGPFVMSSREEIQDSITRYRSGQMGRVVNSTYERVRLRR